MVFGARHLRSVCRQTGVPVSFRDVSTYEDGEPVKGLVDQPVQFKLEDSGIGGVASPQPELRLPFNAFATMPDSGDTLTVDGTAYTVNAPTAEDDGAFLCYQLLATS